MKRILVVEDDRTTQHLIGSILKSAGYAVTAVNDGPAALVELKSQPFDLVLTDIWMPQMNGIDLLAELRKIPHSPRAVVLTSDTTPETLLRAIREQAYQFLTKPVQGKELLELVQSTLEAPGEIPPIEVISAKPDWVELLVPCEMSTAERLQGFIARLDTDLSDEVRGAVGQVFREMLLNAIEWGGQLDPNRKVRIAYLRARRMVLYRIADPGPGFKFEDLTHAAVAYSPEDRLQYVDARLEKGLRPGGFGILMAQAMVDELIYNEVHNEVVFVKYLD
jgi:CheY-like chemotaxis protein/anti-sigma regulatory factor (Ser/Thr protein kinase)